MKKIAVVLIPLLVLVLVLGALGCSKTVYVVVTPTPTVAPTPTPTLAPTPTPTPTPTPVLSPTPTPTPMPPPTAADHAVQPCAFYGSVLLNGVNAPAGTLVTAIVAGYGYPAYTTTVSGVSHYYVVVYQGEGSPISYEGKTVTFMVNNVMTTQTGTWTGGNNIQKNLTSP